MKKIILSLFVLCSSSFAIEAYLNRISEHSHLMELYDTPSISRITKVACRTFRFTKVKVLEVQWENEIALVKVINSDNCDKNKKYYIQASFIELKK